MPFLSGREGYRKKNYFFFLNTAKTKLFGFEDALLRQSKIIYNFLTAAKDRDTLILGVKKVREIMKQEPIGRYIVREIRPGSGSNRDEDILDFLEKSGRTSYHPVGTCRMGSDEEAVVDPRLRVNGVQSLRVVDASIMPTLVSGNTNAPVIMIGEKASDMILEDAVG